jgi:hypothetical protein
MGITKHGPPIVSKVSQNFVVLDFDFKIFFWNPVRAQYVDGFFPVFLYSVNSLVCEIVVLS